ncbi:MAG: ABC transporter transmembrane domain-containing protein, partial [Acetobacter sp.]|nr:ABC transporter transmembrane domain-containing protein [Acetobacter sp.]
MNVWKFLLLIIRKNKFWFIASCILAMLPSTLSAYGQLYYAKIISIIGENPHNALSAAVINCLIILAAIYIGEDIFQGIRLYVDARMKIRYQRTMHNTLLKHNHKHSANFFNTEQSGKILAKTGDIVFGMFQIFGNLREKFLPHIAFFLTTAVLLFNVNIYLGAILLILNVIEPLIIARQYKKLQPYIKAKAKEQSKITGILTDSIANARLVKNTA